MLLIKESLPTASEFPVSFKAVRMTALLVLLVGTIWFVAGDVLSQYLAGMGSSFVASTNITTSSSSSGAAAPVGKASGGELLDIYPSDIKEGVLAAFYGQITYEKEQDAPRQINSSSLSNTPPATNPFPFPPKAQKPPKRSSPSSSSPFGSSNAESPFEGRKSSIPPAFEERMERMMEGKDPAVRERIEMMMQRMREANPGFDG